MKNFYPRILFLLTALVFQLCLPDSVKAQCLCFGGVPATPVVQSVSIAPTQSSTLNFTFNQFDPSVGTLSCITLVNTISGTSYTGARVTLTATVTGDPPTGTVTFCDGAATINASCTGGTLLCASALTATTATSSTASCTTTFSSPGTHLLGAFYAGDGNYTATATEQALAETVASPAVPAPLLSPWLLGLLGGLLAAIGLARVTGNRSSQNG